MSYTAVIRSQETGEARVYVLKDCEWDWPGGHWLWSDGNFGCDCNRRLFFLRAGEEDENTDQPCSEGLFAVRIFNQQGESVCVDSPLRANGKTKGDPEC